METVPCARESFVYLYFFKMGRRTKEFLEELKAWCDQERGRQTRIAEIAEASKQAVSNWFAGRQEPTAEQLLSIQEHLKEEAEIMPL